MIEPEAFLKTSPFNGDTNYNLSNTTPDLLKFQLQQEHKNRLEMLETQGGEFAYNEDFLNSSFNNHLQLKLDEGDILIEELPSLISTPTSESDKSETLVDNRMLNYLNLKVLIENSVFEISKITKKLIVSLDSIKRIKSLIDEKTELKNYYSSKLSISQQFISNVVNEDVDPSILIKIVKSNNLLNNKIIELSEEIGDLSMKLNNHNLSCLLLGYVEDIKISNNLSLSSGNASPNYKIVFDKFISYIVSLSVKKNITLPPPTSDNESIEAKFDWIKECVDILVSSNSNTPLSSADFDQNLPKSSIPSASTRENSPRNMADVTDMNNTSLLNESSIFSMNPSNAADFRIINDYKTALNDLRFSHQYLIKEFEYSRENSLKIIQDYRKRVSSLEAEVEKYKLGQSNKSINEITDEAKDKEIAKLKSQLALLKIDKLGEEGEDEDRKKSMSNAILRKEFKKIVSDIQDQYEIELGHERILRQELQNKINQSENQSRI